MALKGLEIGGGGGDSLIFQKYKWGGLVVIKQYIYRKPPKVLMYFSGIVPLPKHRLNLAEDGLGENGGGSIKPREDWTICTR